MRRTFFLAFLLTITAHAQWTLLDSHSTADFRGVSSVGKGIVWVSGTNGTVLRSEDAGYLWQHCTTPPGAEKLDFRGIQAFDANTAIVMSSGKGDLSRLYKTADGCQTWKLVFTNPDAEGFWDALVMKNEEGFIIGDPVDGEFRLFCKIDDDPKWSECWNEHTIPTRKGEAVFAASNSSIFIQNGFALFGSGGSSGSLVHVMTHSNICVDCSAEKTLRTRKQSEWATVSAPLGSRTESSGIFSIGARLKHSGGPFGDNNFVAVGGDYLKQNDSTSNAAYSTDGGKTWTASTTPPHGYRSAVAYDPSIKTWITVGPNGTDVSTDDGRNWRALKPGSNEQPDADQHWNALSLPFVVGPHGRIGVLNPAALSVNGAASSQPRAKP